MSNTPNLIKTALEGNQSGYRAGVRAERKRNLEELKRIHSFPEMGAREQLNDYIKHLEKQE